MTPRDEGERSRDRDFPRVRAEAENEDARRHAGLIRSLNVTTKHLRVRKDGES
jgi:hypothetical protein